MATPLERQLVDGERAIWVSPTLRALGVPHGFTTRSSWDGGAIDEHLAAGLDVPAPTPVASLRQVHGALVHRLGVEPPGPETCGDALVSDRPGHLLLVRTADCVPILLSSSDGRRVAAVHAGWRGLVAGVVPAALEALGEAACLAAVGPCLSLARFEVGPEVARAFASAGLADAVRADGPGRPHVDLRLAARLQLERGGATAVDVSDRCTWDDPELFSHRRDVTHGGRSSTGRLGALIAPRARRR